MPLGCAYYYMSVCWRIWMRSHGTMEALLGIETGESARASHPYDFSAIYPFNSQRWNYWRNYIQGRLPLCVYLVEEVIRLFRLNNFGLEENVWLGWLQALSGNVYRNYSKDGLLFLFGSI